MSAKSFCLLEGSDQASIGMRGAFGLWNAIRRVLENLNIILESFYAAAGASELLKELKDLILHKRDPEDEHFCPALWCRDTETPGRNTVHCDKRPRDCPFQRDSINKINAITRKSKNERRRMLLIAQCDIARDAGRE
ncbi:hypothetical protein [Nitratireductor sp. GCM10026969]|uniref:hypothetical protein n=1 Tax=Nitratireductor sp. GCM10026969 TaxID=3252645 RepID=UPI00360C5413